MSNPIDDDVFVRWVEGKELTPEEAIEMNQALASDAEIRREATLSLLAFQALRWNPELINGQEPLDEETILSIDRDLGYTPPQDVPLHLIPQYVTDLRARGADFLGRAQAQLDRLADQLEHAAREVAALGSPASRWAVASAASGDVPAALKAYTLAESQGESAPEAFLTGSCEIDEQGRIVLNVGVFEPLRPHWRDWHLDVSLDVTGVTGADEEFDGEASVLLIGRAAVAPNGSVRATLVPEGIKLRPAHNERLRFLLVGPNS